VSGHALLGGPDSLLWCPVTELPSASVRTRGYRSCAGCGEEVHDSEVSSTALRPPLATGAAAVTNW
jgi:hypothetical protein